ncbi:hypothetical protein WUBG_00404 [Wuchereria bancrofti]|uniref:Uncharacterized protein n=1 Tax=Wuchereria bancrofti TaxID=6293 RepID=J9FMT5_WUCBA|nr:hypothetical protein WUBG_00404 [Wuchereria bancrofti]VDM08710.1 unnamed protein product [Wuchereria bancrofti]
MTFYTSVLHFRPPLRPASMIRTSSANHTVMSREVFVYYIEDIDTRQMGGQEMERQTNRHCGEDQCYSSNDVSQWWNSYCRKAGRVEDNPSHIITESAVTQSIQREGGDDDDDLCTLHALHMHSKLMFAYWTSKVPCVCFMAPRNEL